MSYVVINALTVPSGNGEVLEQRFAGRSGTVENAPGFERFELLRPVEGTHTYLVYTRWASKADYTAWLESQSFAHSHAGGQAGAQAGAQAGHGGDAGGPRPQPASTASQIWAFEAVQTAG